MQPGNFIEFLTHPTLFPIAKTTTLATIVQMSTRYVYGPSMPIIQAGAEGTGAHIIIEGTAEQVAANGESCGPKYGPRTLLAPMCMFVSTTYDSTVVARDMVEALEIPRSAMRMILRFDPEFAGHLAQRIDNSLNGLTTRLRQLDAELCAIGALPSKPEPGAAADKSATVPPASPVRKAA